MTKKRKIEILNLLKKEMKKDRLFNGLCMLNHRLLNDYDLILLAENCWLDRLIKKHRPKTSKSSYYWMPTVQAPRIKWINERIKELEGKV